MDFRELYPDNGFLALKADPEIVVFCWKERNGLGIQPLVDVGTDAGTIFLHAKDYEKVYVRLDSTDPRVEKAKATIKAEITRRGISKIPNYKLTDRSFWS